LCGIGEALKVGEKNGNCYKGEWRPETVRLKPPKGGERGGCRTEGECRKTRGGRTRKRKRILRRGGKTKARKK